ncbi:hypothetical protein [Burkholderia diffusa]|uniref:hypothetical protein n=1 Tax=Burkholderia diffusa TaxID=488732 RepID=UPI0012D90377|nr:hypothetical protein [Burkholderia diffusa]
MVDFDAEEISNPADCFVNSSRFGRKKDNPSNRLFQLSRTHAAGVVPDCPHAVAASLYRRRLPRRSNAAPFRCADPPRHVPASLPALVPTDDVTPSPTGQNPFTNNGI